MAHFYWGVREDVNYLLAEGHHNAQRYPIAKVWAEARAARRRWVNKVETDAIVMQAVVGTVMGGKKGQAHFKATLKKIRESDGS